MIGIYSILLYFILYLVNYRHKGYEKLIYVSTGFLFLTPSSPIFGIGYSNNFNFQPTFYFVFFFIPFILFMKRNYVFNKIKKYNKKIGRKLLLILLLLFIQSIYRSFYFGVNLIFDFINFSKYFLTIYILSLFYFAYFDSIDEEKRYYFLKYNFILLAIFSIIIGFSSLNFSSFLISIQDFFYNFKISEDVEITLFKQSVIDSRAYSLFSGANQFGLYSVLLIVFTISTYFKKAMKINTVLIFVAFSLLIMFLTQSRTPFFLSAIFITLISFFSSGSRRFLILFLIIVISPFMIEYLPERIVEALSVNGVNDQLDAQRISFWLLFINRFEFSFEFLFFGLSNLKYLEGQFLFFESGWLNFISKYGVLVFLLFILFIFKNLRNILNKKSQRLRMFLVWAFILFFISEILQGTLETLRYETIFSIIIAISNIDEFKNSNNSTILSA